MTLIEIVAGAILLAASVGVLWTVRWWDVAFQPPAAGDDAIRSDESYRRAA